MVSVALVVLDTLRKDYFDEFFDWLPGRRYTHAYSTANWTSPAHASLFTGKYPSEVGVHAKSPSLDIPNPVLAEHLSNDGYMTRCWTANPNLSQKRNWDRGFDEFVSATDLLTDGRNVVDWQSFGAKGGSDGILKYPRAVTECLDPKVSTLQSLRQGINYFFHGLDGLKDTSDDGAQAVSRRLDSVNVESDDFLFINLMEAHTPYYTPDGFDGPNEKLYVTIKNSIGLEETPDGTQEAYQKSVEYLSTVYQKIFSKLNEKFDYVITMSDNGEMLGDFGTWNHTYGLYPQITHVPLVLTGDGFSGKEDATVSHLDVHRTLVALTGLQIESRGRDLRDIESGEPVLTEYHGLIPIATERLEEEGISLEDYDSELSGIAAPQDYYGFETHDGFQEKGTTKINPQKTIKNIKSSMNKRAVKQSDLEMTDGTMNRLEDLGYL